jgi:hypothetical protein
MKKFSLLILIMFCFNINSDAITLQANLTSNNGWRFSVLTTNSTPVNITSFNTMYSVLVEQVDSEIYSRSVSMPDLQLPAGWNLSAQSPPRVLEPRQLFQWM